MKVPGKQAPPDLAQKICEHLNYTTSVMPRCADCLNIKEGSDYSGREEYFCGLYAATLGLISIAPHGRCDVFNAKKHAGGAQ